MESGTPRLKVGLAEMLKGGVIMDVTNAEQDAGRALPFATVDRTRGVVVGCTRLFNIEFWPWPPGNANQRGPERPDVVEIGWTWLAAAAQRTPINT